MVMGTGFTPVYEDEVGRDVSGEQFDARPRQRNQEDDERRARPVDTKKNKGIGWDTNKFDVRGDKARIYRLTANGKYCQVVLVDFERRDYYLSKAKADGRPVFYPQQPAPLLTVQSDPCPVDVGDGQCGRRMGSQLELIKHIRAKHPGDAPYYLSQEQIDRATGKLAMLSVATVSDASSTLEEEADATEGYGIELASSSYGQGTQEAGAVKKDKRGQRRSTVAHAPHCKTKGRLRRYTPECPACDELAAGD